MVSFLIRLFLGVILVLLPLSLFIKKIRDALKELIDILISKPKKRKLVRLSVTILFIAISEYFGIWENIADLVVPGQATIYIHAPREWMERPDFFHDLRVWFRVVKFNGELNKNKFYNGSFNAQGTFSEVCDFGIGERQVLVEINEGKIYHTSFMSFHIPVSPCTRVKSGEKHFYIRE